MPSTDPLPTVDASAPASPHLSLYGFVAWLGVHVALLLFVLWVYLPESALHAAGVTWYPGRHWALLLPCHALVTIAAAPVLYFAYNMARLPRLDDPSTLVDEFSRPAPSGGCDLHAGEVARDCDDADAGWPMPAVADLPIARVSELLHSAPLTSRAPDGEAGPAGQLRQGSTASMVFRECQR